MRGPALSLGKPASDGNQKEKKRGGEIKLSILNLCIGGIWVVFSWISQEADPQLCPDSLLGYQGGDRKSGQEEQGLGGLGLTLRWVGPLHTYPLTSLRANFICKCLNGS